MGSDDEDPEALLIRVRGGGFRDMDGRVDEAVEARLDGGRHEIVLVEDPDPDEDSEGTKEACCSVRCCFFVGVELLEAR